MYHFLIKKREGGTAGKGLFFVIYNHNSNSVQIWTEFCLRDSTIRSILKKEQGEKIAPYIFKLADTKSLQTYLDKERITYEIYQEKRVFKRVLENSSKESRKKENWQNNLIKQIITFFSTLLIF